MILLKFKKLKRYYHLYQQNNLLGGITLICAWGAFDSKRGGHKFIFCKNQLELYTELAKISKVRLTRNYRLY
ncbi:hypothetical protein Megpolyxen_01855 (plasmid) [Candidatus Megaera polyxenophila]|mgnify:FL=1|jgi:hypothetical protein|nr:hypothetical protein Megpolyxen_01855 [Candidatus Megaera polyxenophila]